ncbi:MAG: CoA transferase [Steroidobacteraceae bacterium]|nr:CoA transferase [Steroidobacteraceae bacterium]MBP7012633.1 CoA transferase [Steroidobacteraceae bacterium]
MDPHPPLDSVRPLAHRPLCLAGRGTATDYARALLASLGATVSVSPGPDDTDPSAAWARSGLMALTGRVDGLPQMCPVAIASCADGVMKALRCVAPATLAGALPAGAALLGERAAIAGLHRNGAVSPGGGCRLLQACDGWFAISLVRETDWAAVPAWLEIERIDTWEAVATAAASRRVETLVERARLLGLAACVSATPTAASKPWYTMTQPGPPASPEQRGGPLRLVDLSSLWAGPLCSHLLQILGARVVKVESLGRPDGARDGPPGFYDLLNAGKRSVGLNFDEAGIARLHELIDWADVVIEGSRPRGLRQLGVIAEDCIARRSGLTWISITGYGRGEPECHWTAFGDDAGVAGGLSALMHEMTGLPLICGDAIADPLVGMHAALAALASHQGGGGRLWSLALRDVVANCVAFSRPLDHAALRERWESWTAAARAGNLDTTPPVARRTGLRARNLGADTDSVLAGWAIRADT